MTNQQKLKKLYARLDELAAYGRSIGKLNFDMECCAPEEGIRPAGEDMAILGKQIHKLSHDKRFEALICELHADSEGLSPVQKKTVEHLYDGYAKSKNIGAKLSYEMDLASGKAYGAWLSAKRSSDFSLFRDALFADDAALAVWNPDTGAVAFEDAEKGIFGAPVRRGEPRSKCGAANAETGFPSLLIGNY